MRDVIGDKLRYQTSIHHRQNLRSQIDQRMLEQIEISPTPSMNYQKAYQSLYKDELQKSVDLQNKKKDIEQTRKIYDTLVSNRHQNLYRSGELTPLNPDMSTLSLQDIKNLNYRDVGYVNYDVFKDTKALDHTLRNYDGGEGFYRNCDQHLMKQRIEQNNMKLTLLKQLRSKEREKSIQMMKKREEEGAIKMKENITNHNYSLSNAQQRRQKQQHRSVILQQINEQRIRRGHRSIFNYDNNTRHNPITNPIQYHIDNPYILKQIQTKNKGNY